MTQRAEEYARAAGATELRIGVLTQNDAARRLYHDAAFVPHVEILIKRWRSMTGLPAPRSWLVLLPLELSA